MGHADFAEKEEAQCASYEKKIRNLLVGVSHQLAGKTGTPGTEFTETEDDHNGRKTTHHRVEKVDGKDGLITHHTHSTAVPEALVSLAVGRGSFQLRGKGHTQTNKGVVED